jgi:hypothetical protein
MFSFREKASMPDSFLAFAGKEGHKYSCMGMTSLNARSDVMAQPKHCQGKTSIYCPLLADCYQACADSSGQFCWQSPCCPSEGSGLWNNPDFGYYVCTSTTCQQTCNTQYIVTGGGEL